MDLNIYQEFAERTSGNEQERVELAIKALEIAAKQTEICGDIMGEMLDALREKLERMNPQPLTVEELKNLPIHEQVYVYFTEPYSSRGEDVPSAYYFKIKATIPRDAFAFGYPGVCFEFSYTDYGDTWEAYRTKPEGGRP